MGRWLEKLKEKTQDLLPDELKKLKEVPFFGFFSRPQGRMQKNQGDPKMSTTGPVNVFARCIPRGVVVCLPCMDHPDCWIAHKTGTLEPVGHGPDQVEAIMDLDRLEAERGHTDV
mgnify:CR=1 FL=1